MSKQLRVGVIGCGGIAQMMHLPTLAERPDLFTIAGLADVSRPTLEAVGKRYGVSALYTDHRELLARCVELDAVLLLASGSHQEAALAALEAKKHLFVEKPLGYCRAEVTAIGEAADRAGTTLFVGYHKRYDPAYARAKEAVLALDQLRFVEVTALHPDDGAYRAHHAVLPLRAPAGAVLSLEEEARGDRGALEKATQGAVAGSIASICGADAPFQKSVAALVLSESLIHDVNLLRGILGEPVEVLSAHAWRNGLAQTSVTRFPRDVSAVMSWVSAPGLKNYEEKLRFIGANGRVTLTFPSPYLRHAPTPLTIERMDGEELVVEERVVSYEEAFRAELFAFHRAVKEASAPITGWKDALGDALYIEEIVAKMVVAPSA
jgi:predicted dehydrogenase